MSSLNSHLPSESEVSYMTSTKPEMNDMLKEDLKSFKKQSTSRFTPRESKVKRGMAMVNNDELQNKLLRQKLEMIQTLQHDIMQMLDQEMEENDHHVTEGDDPSDLVNALEIRTELLRKQMIRRHKQRSKSNSSCYSPHSETIKTTEIDNADDLVEPIETIQASRKGSTISNFDHDVITDDINSVVDAKHMDAPEVSLNKEESDTASIPPGAIQDGNKIEMDDDNNTFELSTIEEQPEYGYQSDSSDTDMLLPKALGNRAKSVTADQNLPTLDEEDSGNPDS